VHIKKEHSPNSSRKSTARPRLLYSCFACDKKFASEKEKFDHVRTQHLGRQESEEEVTNSNGNTGQLDEDHAVIEGNVWPQTCEQEYNGWQEEHQSDLPVLYYCAACPAVTLYT